MERENRKRGREEVECFLSDQYTRKKDEAFLKCGKFTQEEEEEEENKVEGNENVVGGVFDFPWLKEGGVISKSEEWHYYEEDVFSETALIELSGGECFCESAATCMSSINFPVDLFEENVWSLEDCNSWTTSLLNQQTLSNN